MVSRVAVGGVEIPVNGLVNARFKRDVMPHKTRKDRRKEYTGSKRFDSSCRCHGGCPWCESNRLYQDTRRRVAADEQIKFSEMMVYGTSEHEQRLCGWDW